MSENDGLEVTQREDARRQGLENASVPNGREIGTRKLLQLSRSAFHEITRFHAWVRGRAAGRKLAVTGPLEWLFDNYYIVLREYRRASSALAGYRLASVQKQDKAAVPYIFQLAMNFCTSRAYALDEPALRAYFEGAGQARDFTGDEIFLLPDMFRLAIIFGVRDECRRLRAALNAGARPEDARVMQNAVLSLKMLDGLDMSEYTEILSQTERTLARDAVYPRMTQTSRWHYRARLKRLAKQNGMSMKAQAEALVREVNADPELDLGAVLKARTDRRAPKIMYFVIYIFSALVIAVLPAALLRSAGVGLLLFLPALEVSRRLADALAAKMVDDTYLPRLDFEKGIPDDARTCVAVSLLLGQGSAAKIYGRLELLYNKNRDDNLLFGVVADFGESDSEYESGDDAVLEQAADAVGRLNAKYGDRFFLLVRRRTYCETQRKFIGWERKRGSVIELVRYMKGEKTTHGTVAGAVSLLPGCRYTIVLDADTALPIDGAKELVSIAAHPANRPVIDENRRRVVSGYGLIAPAVRSELVSDNDTFFSKLYAGLSGVETYNNTSFELYQDVFGEGIFSGKGIFHNDVFYELLADSLPENMILSHDLLEGSVIRTGHASDIRVYDSVPKDMVSYYKREHRWIRGDWQLLKMLPSPALGWLDRFKILDNLRRSLNAPFFILILLSSLFLSPVKSAVLLSILIVIYLFPIFATFVKQLFFGIVLKGNVRYYSGAMPPVFTMLWTTLAELVFLPYAAVNALDAIVRALYRLFVSKKHLLDWVTAAQAEQEKPASLWGYAKRMAVSVLLSALVLAGVLVRLFVAGGAPGFAEWLMLVISLLWLCAPVLACLLAKQKKQAPRPLTDEANANLLEYAKKMWQYYADFLTEDDNYLLPDNYQETPSVGLARRTSPTNIGFSLLAVLSARDFHFVTTATMGDYLEKIYASLCRLDRYRGHFYNWYDTANAEPLAPRYVSTVDSGNLSVCLSTLCSGLEEYAEEDARIPGLIQGFSALESEADYGFLYNPAKKLFHIGFDVQAQTLTENYYDLYMSESRLTSYYLTARGEVPLKHWRALSRLVVEHRGHFGFKSWTGTMFEYFMPYLFLPAYRHTQTFEALSFALEAQEDRVRGKRGVPFGISESGFYAFDAALNYQYKAFGVSRIGLKRDLNSELVISPYSTFLTLPFAPEKSYANLMEMEKLGFTGKYGFYEAIDYTPARTGGRACVVRSFMAHHIGMSLLSVANLLMDNIVQRRFCANPHMRAYDELLQEKLPEKVLVYNMPDDTPRKVTTHHYESPVLAVHSIRPFAPYVGALSNGSYTAVLSDSGFGFSQYDGRTVTRYRKSVTENGKGIYFALQSGSSRLSLSAAPLFQNPQNYSTEFEDSQVVYRASNNVFSTRIRATVHDAYAAEIREIKIKNNTNKKKFVTLLAYFEPVLWEYENEAAHPAFASLSMEAQRIENENAVLFHRRPRGQKDPHLYLCAGFCRPDVSASFETTRDYVFGRASKSGDLMRAFRMNFTGVKKACLDAAFAAKLTFELDAKESRKFLFAMVCDTDAGRAVDAFRAIRRDSYPEIQRRYLETARHMLAECDMTETELQLERAVLPRLIYRLAETPVDRAAACEKTQADLWKYGVSGDDPILLVRIYEAEDVPKIIPYLKVFHLLKHKHIACELVLLYEEGGQYDRPVHTGIQEVLRQYGLEKYAAARGGIILCNLQSAEDEALFYTASSYVVDYKRERTPEHCERDRAAVPALPAPAAETGLQIRYPTVCGGFVEDGFAVTDKQAFPTRPPWCNILSNYRFGTVVSDSSLGYTYALNASQFRITPWYNDAVSDNYGEKLYMKYKGEIYDVIAGASAAFYRGYAEYVCAAGDVRVRTTVFVPSGEQCKTICIEAENSAGEPADVSFCYGADLVLGQTFHKDDRMIRIEEKDGVLYARNPYHTEYGTGVVYLTGFKADAVGISKLAFLCGEYEDARRMVSGEEPFAYCMKRLSLPAGGKERTVFVLGFSPGRETARLAAERVDVWRAREWLDRQALPQSAAYAPLRVQTPDRAFDEFVNTFLYYQAIQSRITARTAFYQSSGAYGFRDQLQDAMSVSAVDPSHLRRQIIRSCLHQFEEGDVMHWWHHVPGRGRRDKGVRTRCSDDLLWLPLAAAEYVKKTGDGSILRRVLPYLKAPVLERHENERYSQPGYGALRETVYQHCVRTFRYGLRCGKHGLLLFGGGDWNDGYSSVGVKGVGESVWLSMFAVYVINEFLPLCRLFADGETYTFLLSHKRKLIEAVESHAWDGQWYRRGYYDNGSVMGGAESDECKIDLLPQSFAALCGVFRPDRTAASVQAMDQYLLDRSNRLVKLFTPPFTKGTNNPGYINGYVEGVRENGGQYTHGACFAAFACYRSGRAGFGYEILDLLNPLRKYGEAGPSPYRNEPYVLSGDVYAAPAFLGRGGWSWYTGAAGWYFRIVLEELLGVKTEGERAYISPKPPAAWDAFSFTVKLRGTEVAVQAKRGEESTMFVDGLRAGFVPLDGRRHAVEIVYESQT